MTIRSRERQAAIKHANKMKSVKVGCDFNKRNHDDKQQLSSERLAKAALNVDLPDWARANGSSKRHNPYL